jgi:hypothetical protein
LGDNSINGVRPLRFDGRREGGAASAQVSCERYRAELASLSRAGASIRAYEAAAQRQRYEMARLIGYYRSIGCDRAFFFFQAPPECGGIAQRIRGMQANEAALAQQAVSDPGAILARRRQLEAAIAKTCDASSLESTEPPPLQATGGSRLVCVRACDGYFFPLQNEPQGRATTRDLCRALCPNAEVSVFRAPRDGGIEQAVSETGQPYMKLANALRYQRAYDPSCSCRKPGESWAQALQKAERMIARSDTDIVVTARNADRLSRVALARPKTGSKGAKPADGARLSTASSSSRDPETTGSIPAGTPERPRIIAPDQIPALAAQESATRE